MTPSPIPRLSTSNLLQQIRSILVKPKVCVRPSTLPSGGRGVFCAFNNHDDNNDNHNVNNVNTTPLPAHTVVALYPGIYTPPMPTSAISTHDQDIDVSTLYLASIQSPSGIPSEHNAYLLNLASTTRGGYLDGMALTCPTTGRRLDAHPSAVGHLLNHHPSMSNVSVVSFDWETILEEAAKTTDVDVDDNDDNDDDDHPLAVLDETSIPNVVRCDGSPWYWDTQESRLVRFPTHLPQEKSLTQKSCGAAMVLHREVEPGEELFLDYGLRTNPLPAWAEGWYVASNA